MSANGDVVAEGEALSGCEVSEVDLVASVVDATDAKEVLTVTLMLGKGYAAQVGGRLR